MVLFVADLVHEAFKLLFLPRTMNSLSSNERVEMTIESMIKPKKQTIKSGAAKNMPEPNRGQAGHGNKGNFSSEYEKPIMKLISKEKAWFSVQLEPKGDTPEDLRRERSRVTSSASAFAKHHGKHLRTHMSEGNVLVLRLRFE